MTKTCEALENTILQLETDLEQENVEIILTSLEKQLSKTQEQTGQWLALQEEAAESFSLTEADTISYAADVLASAGMPVTEH